MTPTVPAQASAPSVVPLAALLTPLAKAALESGVSPDDVRAYLLAQKVRK